MDEEISELMAIGDTAQSIHCYGDLSDDEDDVEGYANFRFMMHNKVTSTIIFILPREIERGEWGIITHLLFGRIRIQNIWDIN